MSNSNFFTKSFDSGTLLKLKVFSGYYRNWIPVFLTKSDWKNQPQIYIYDFFAGAGNDANGNPGSPLLLLQELKNYCQENKRIRAEGVTPTILFNDHDHKNIETLKEAVEKERCPSNCCRIHYSEKEFHDAFIEALPTMQRNDTACLVIMDQYGIGQITEDVIKALDKCPKTDFIFFISSDFLYRFRKQDSINRILDIGDCPYHDVHRKVCERYKSFLPDESDLRLAPFSIRKDNGNIYGIIFGSHHLLGLEKFLRVCWDIDQATGEANYDIDDDGSARDGQMDLFEKVTVKKQDKFESDLLSFIKIATDNMIVISSRDIYRFTLENGFLPTHSSDVLKQKNKEQIITIKDKDFKKINNPRGLYLSSKYLYDKEHIVYFSWNK